MREAAGTNPFNSTRPGNLFVGYEDLRRNLMSGLANGHSYALLGGRRCGKTSLLLQLEADLRSTPAGARTLLPRHFDIQSEIPRTPTDFFQSISRRLVDGTAVPPWDGSTQGRQPYQSFGLYLHEFAPQLNEAHGPDWLCVLLIDELEVSANYLDGDECFQNLRHLLKRSEFATRLAVVIAGSTGLSELTKAGSALSNILEKATLAVLSPSDARRLMRSGHDAGRVADQTLSAAEEQLLTLTGGHPWMLQALMEQIWEQRL